MNSKTSVAKTVEDDDNAGDLRRIITRGKVTPNQLSSFSRV